MSITTGQFFTCILLGTVPTALGQALYDLPANPAQWTPANWAAALQYDIDQHITTEDPDVVAALKTLLITDPYTQIFAALLTPVSTPDGHGGYSAPVPLAQVLLKQTAAIGKTPNLLNVIWTDPPHPRDGDVTNLIDTLGDYDEDDD